MSKSIKHEILENQKIVAKTISEVQEDDSSKNNYFNDGPFEKTETTINENNEKLTRGWYDFKAINLRFNNKSIFSKFFPDNVNHQNLFRLLNSCRSLFLGFNEFKGCKKNIKNYFGQLNFLFDYEFEKKHETLFKSLLNFLKKKEINLKNLKKYYPKILKSDLEELYTLINNQKEFSKKCVDLIKKISETKNNKKQNPPQENEKNNNKNKDGNFDKKLKKKKTDLLPRVIPENLKKQSDVNNSSSEHKVSDIQKQKNNIKSLRNNLIFL